MRIGNDKFFGQRPRVASHLLPESFAQIAQNVDTSSGALSPMRRHSRVAALYGTDIQSLYKWVENSNPHWISSVNALDYAKSPAGSDLYERVYFTGEAEPRAHANDIVSAPFDPSTDFYKLGVPAPTGKPTIESGYTPDSTYRAYIYCFVTAYGELGPPYQADIASISDYGSGDVTLSHIEAPAGFRRITKIWLYRTNSGDSGAEFDFAKEYTLPAFAAYSGAATYNDGDYVSYGSPGLLYKCIHNSTTGIPPDDPVNGVGGSGDDYWEYFTLTDDVADEDLGETCPSRNWDPPPAALCGLTVHAAGFFAGFTGHTVYLSEPGLAHAWPYSYSFENEVVAIEAFGNSIAVLTKGYPYLLTGSAPEQMSKNKLAVFYPCLSRRSAVVADNGVLYASKTGLIGIDEENGAVNTTAEIFTEKEWEKYATSQTIGAYSAKKYIGFSGQTGFVIDFSTLSFATLTAAANAVFPCNDDGCMYLVMPDDYDLDNPPSPVPLCVRMWEGNAVDPMFYRWRSRIYITPSRTNFSCARIMTADAWYDSLLSMLAESELYAGYNEDFFDDDLIEGGFNERGFNVHGFNGDCLYELPAIQASLAVRFRYYCDNVLRTEKNVIPGQPFRMPKGFGGKTHMYEIEAAIAISRVDIANSMKELAS